MNNLVRLDICRVFFQMLFVNRTRVKVNVYTGSRKQCCIRALFLSSIFVRLKEVITRPFTIFLEPLFHSPFVSIIQTLITQRGLHRPDNVHFKRRTARNLLNTPQRKVADYLAGRKRKREDVSQPLNLVQLITRDRLLKYLQHKGSASVGYLFTNVSYYFSMPHYTSQAVQNLSFICKSILFDLAHEKF